MIIQYIMTCEGLLLAVNPFIFIHRVCLSADLSPDEVVWLDKLAGPLVSYTLRGCSQEMLLRRLSWANLKKETNRVTRKSKWAFFGHFLSRKKILTEIYSYCTQHLTMYFTLCHKIWFIKVWEMTELKGITLKIGCPMNWVWFFLNHILQLL